MLNQFAEVVTRQTPSNKIVLRTRKYDVEGNTYCIIKHFLRDGCFSLTKYHPTYGYMYVKVDGKQEWGAGISWKQAEKIAERTIASYKKVTNMFKDVADKSGVKVKLVPEVRYER